MGVYLFRYSCSELETASSGIHQIFQKTPINAQLLGDLRICVLAAGTKFSQSNGTVSKTGSKQKKGGRRIPKGLRFRSDRISITTTIRIGLVRGNSSMIGLGFGFLRTLRMEWGNGWNCEF